MNRRLLNPTSLPIPKGTYHQVAIAPPGQFVAIAGQAARDETGIVCVGDVRGQTRFVLNKVRSAIESVGGNIADIIAVTVYITDARFYNDVNEVRLEEWGTDTPTSTMIEVNSLVSPEMLVEVTALAVVPENRLI